MKVEKLTDEQEELLDGLSDQQLEQACRDRGIWFDEMDCPECEDCPECRCEDFENDCEAMRQAFLRGQPDKVLEMARALVDAVTGRYV